jgi:hypothetical protein
VSKLLDLELFPAAPSEGLLQHLPHVKLLSTRSVPQHTRRSATAAGAAAGDDFAHDPTEVHFEVFTEKPCWGTFKVSGADIVSWSLFDDAGWTDAASFMESQQRGSGSTLVTRKKGAEGIAVDSDEDWGDGVVRSLVVKWTSERQQGPLHWPMRVRYYSKQQQQSAAGDGDSSSSNGLQVELHVGYVERTAALAAVQARMPEWSTLTYEATTYISTWEF